MNNRLLTSQSLATREDDVSDQSLRLIALGKMAASLAHEIRNPLGSMELYVGLLRRDAENNPKLAAVVEQLQTSIKRVDRIINNCLQFAGDIKPNSAFVPNFEDELEQIIECCITGDPRFSDVDISLEVDEELKVSTDLYLLEQVITNLLRNALDAFPPDCHNASITVLAATMTGGGWFISVTDNGSGIAEEDLKQVCEPFYSTKRGGTGLGLSITRMITQALGGTLHIASAIGHGTTVMASWTK